LSAFDVQYDLRQSGLNSLAFVVALVMLFDLLEVRHPAFFIASSGGS
jgi:hypothetical protein